MRSPLLMLIPAVLMAQRSALPPQEAFDRELKKNRLGTWLVLEDDGAAWGSLVRAALDDDLLVSLNLPLRVVAGGKKPDALAATLRERYGWAKGAHWALVDAKGRVLVEGASQPTLSGLVSAVEGSGVRSRAQELEDFLRQNPDHLEAKMALLGEYLIVASRGTRKALPVPAEPPAGSRVAAEPPRKLDSETDLKIWSKSVQQLERIFQNGWQEVGFELGMRLRNSEADRSPSMVALLTRYKGDMEEAIRRRPNASDPWMVWVQSSRICGGWALSPLLQSTLPLPGTEPWQWPPMAALGEYVRDAKARQDWVSLRDTLTPRWEQIQAGEGRYGGGSGLWAGLLSPLLEALLSLGDVGAADQLVGEAVATDGWSGIPGQARDLATRLNRPDLAARWGALTPKGR